jgi:hypothetical protein
MPPTTPAYRLHKPTGLAVVRLNGKDIYLGKHGTPESLAKYDTLTGEWKNNGRQLPAAKAAAEGSSPGVTVAEIIVAYWVPLTAEHTQAVRSEEPRNVSL